MGFFFGLFILSFFVILISNISWIVLNAISIFTIGIQGVLQGDTLVENISFDTILNTELSIAELLEKTRKTLLLDLDKEKDLFFFKNFKINSINKINLISEEITSNLVKDIFGEDPNKSSVKAIVNEIMKGHKF